MVMKKIKKVEKIVLIKIIKLHKFDKNFDENFFSWAALPKRIDFIPPYLRFAQITP